MALRPADQSSYQNQSQAALHLPTVVVHLVPRTWDDWRPTHASHLDGISQRRCLFRNRRWTFTRWISFFLSTSIDILKSTIGWLFDWLSFQAIPYWFTLSLTLVYLPSKFISLVTMSCGMKSKTIRSIKAPDTRPYPSPWKKYRVWLPFIDYHHHTLLSLFDMFIANFSSQIPVFQRGGAIVSKKERARRASTAMSKDPYTLIVTLDQQVCSKKNK